MASKVRLGYDILSKRAIETESGVNIDDAIGTIRDNIGNINTSLANKAEKTELLEAVLDLEGNIGELSTSIENIENDISDLTSGKQDIISDLETIRTGAAAGATAYHSVSAINDKIPDDAAIDNKLVTKDELVSALGDIETLLADL